MEGIDELAPVAFGAFDGWTVGVEDHRVRRLFLGPQRIIRVVAEGVDAPGGKALRRGLVEGRLPIVAIFQHQVVLREIEASGILPEIVIARHVAHPAQIEGFVGFIVRRQVRKPMLPLINDGGVANAHAVDAEREEEMAIGINELPFPFVLCGAEKARGFELRTVFPSAESIPGCWRLGGGEMLGLLVFAGAQFFDGVQFCPANRDG